MCVVQVDTFNTMLSKEAHITDMEAFVDAFCELCRTEAVKALFAQHGYGASKPAPQPK